MVSSLARGFLKRGWHWQSAMSADRDKPVRSRLTSVEDMEFDRSGASYRRLTGSGCLLDRIVFARAYRAVMHWSRKLLSIGDFSLFFGVRLLEGLRRRFDEPAGVLLGLWLAATVSRFWCGWHGHPCLTSLAISMSSLQGTSLPLTLNHGECARCRCITASL